MMETPGGLAAGLAFLPSWMREERDGFVLDALFNSWIRASGWLLAGVAWPIAAPSTIFTVREDLVDTKASLPHEWKDIADALTHGGNSTVIWAMPNSPGRLYALLQIPGRAAGLIWVEREHGTWTAEERAYLKLSAKLIERCPSLHTRIGGTVIDPDRLQQRLADASVIAGRMAHDFDNVLTGIMGFADLTLPLVADREQPAKFVQEIAKVGQRGITFTSQLHDLSRAAQARPMPGNIASALAKEDLRLRSSMPPGIKIRVDIPAGLPMVAMDTAPLQTVLGHILENAIEACTGTSTIFMSARNVEVNATDAQGFLGRVYPGPHVEVTFVDNGSGIKPDVRAKLFAEPFFTTKVRHRGLGLAIVYRTLHAHRGGVRIDAAPSQEPGTVVRVVVPHAAARPAIVAAATPSHTPGG